MTDVLELDGIYLEYDLSKILTSIYLKCETGQIVGLLGRNGSGKSSLMKIAFGSLQAHSKSVRINDVFQIKPFNKEINYLPQEPLIPTFIPISKALKLYNVPQESLYDVFPETRDVMNEKPSAISGGTLRIIEVLMILNAKPRFALLDEPFSGLMPVHIDTLKDYLKFKKKEKGIIITDHLYKHVTDLSDHLYVLSNGKTYPVKNKDQLMDLGYVPPPPGS